MKQIWLKAVLAGLVLIGSVATVSAAPLSIFDEPDDLFKNTENNPCIFGETGGCNDGPTGWPAPAGPTQNNFDPLTKTYAGTDYDLFKATVGNAFLLGLDINDDVDPQTLTGFTITFSTGLTYTFAPPTDVPSTSNGNGYADYVLAAGCTAGESAEVDAIHTCTLYTPFVVPADADSVVFTFSYGSPSTGNDGPDKVFLITSGSSCPGCGPNPTSVVPEPASLFLLGTGLTIVAARARRRRG